MLIMAYLGPMQFLEPPAKGMKVKGWRVDEVERNLSGSNFKGSGQYLGSLWTRMNPKATDDPFGSTRSSKNTTFTKARRQSTPKNLRGADLPSGLSQRSPLLETTSNSL
jgi:hypothetical protein